MRFSLSIMLEKVVDGCEAIQRIQFQSGLLVCARDVPIMGITQHIWMSPPPRHGRILIYNYILILRYCYALPLPLFVPLLFNT